MIASTSRKQILITYVSLGLLQQNKDFLTPLEEVNKMVSRFVLVFPALTKKEAFKKFTNFFQQYANNSPFVFNVLYWKFMLVLLCWVLADLVTYVHPSHFWI